MIKGKKVRVFCKNCNKEMLLNNPPQTDDVFCSKECVDVYKKDKNDIDEIFSETEESELAEFNKVVKQQNNKCLICNLSFDVIKPQAFYSHQTNELKGVICDRCYKGLNCFSNNTSLLLKALNFISK